MRIAGWTLLAGGIVAALWLGARRKREDEGERSSVANGLISRPTSLDTLQGCLVRIEELRRRRGATA